MEGGKEKSPSWPWRQFFVFKNLLTVECYFLPYDNRVRRRHNEKEIKREVNKEELILRKRLNSKK